MCSNKPAQPVPGAFDIAPSAAGVIYNYYKNLGKLDNRFDELAEQTDIIDSAALTKEQVRAPEDYPYIILSMTIQNRDFNDIPYWNRLVEMLRQPGIESVMADPEVDRRCRAVVKENNEFSSHLKTYTTVDRNNFGHRLPPPGPGTIGQPFPYLFPVSGNHCQCKNQIQGP